MSDVRTRTECGGRGEGAADRSGVVISPIAERLLSFLETRYTYCAMVAMLCGGCENLGMDVSE